MMNKAIAKKPSRRKTLQQGKYKLKNMKFLGDFMAALNLTTTTAGEKAGYTQVTVYYWLKKDNAHLSSVEKLINAWGYVLQFDLISSDEVSIVDLQMEAPRRLAFLEKALIGADKAKLCEQLGISPSTIYYWLSHDDIFISYIYRIAEILCMKVKITIRPKR